MSSAVISLGEFSHSIVNRATLSAIRLASLLAEGGVAGP
jgi:hypothetical protein